MAPKNSRGDKDAREGNPRTDCVDELLAPIVPDEPVPQPKSPQHEAVGALFRNEANLRQAIAENLKPLRAESMAVDNRVKQAFKNFNPAPLSSEDCARGRYVEPGADPSEVLTSVIMSGADALRSSNNSRAITLRKTPELRRLIREAPEPTDSLEGVVDLDPLIKHIYRMSAGASLTSEPVFKRCKAELEAETILGVAEKPKNANGGSVANLEESSSGSGTREAQQLVEESVNLQMKSATAPESRLEYAYIPNSAEKDKVQNAILQTFQLRPGASDVTSYHDFHTLQIAFPHVWTRIFDGQLESLGRGLYEEYVKLKKFTGSTDTDPTISTLNDLRRLMDRVRKLSQSVQDDIRGVTGGDSKDNSPKGAIDLASKGSDLGNVVRDTVNDPGKAAAAALSGGMTVLLNWIASSLTNNAKVVAWASFPLVIQPSSDEQFNDVIELLPLEENAVSSGDVEFVLLTRTDSFKKILEFQHWNVGSKSLIASRQADNFSPGASREKNAVTVPWDWLQSGVLKFGSEDKFANNVIVARYLLGDLTQKLKDRMRVTFNWRGRR